MFNNTVPGIDMTFMFKGTTKLDKAEVKAIDGYIQEMTTQNHPEIVPVLMEELSLHRFWKKLNNSHNHKVIDFLAAERMLNFYEAATQSGFDIHSLRIGMIACALTATIYIKPQHKSIPSGMTCSPSFFDPKDLDVEQLEIKQLTPEHIESLMSVLQFFYKRSRKLPKVKGEDSVKVHMLDAMRMWTISENADLRAFMAGRFSRVNLLTPEQKMLTGIICQLGYGDISAYKYAVDLTCFNTRWARTKSFKYNIAAKVKEIAYG